MDSVFEDFLREIDVPDRTLAIVGDEQPEPIRELFQNAFGGLDIDLDTPTINTDHEDTVVLLEDGDVVTTSSIETLRNAVLLVNSDLYMSGLSGIDKYEAPEVLTQLDEGVYTLRGFPESTKEKLLLIVMSRYIEQRALSVGEGRLDVAFQQLSRIEDEYGTKRIYNRLSGMPIDLHLYGIPDSYPDGLGEVTIHTGRSDRYQNSWFVVFTPPSGHETEASALVAVETDRNVWRSRWTYSFERVDSIRRRIVDRF